MRISDWSSDVCSSDLDQQQIAHDVLQLDLDMIDAEVDSGLPGTAHEHRADDPGPHQDINAAFDAQLFAGPGRLRPRPLAEIGRASRRDRVCQYVYISVVAVSLNKKTHHHTPSP